MATISAEESKYETKAEAKAEEDAAELKDTKEKLSRVWLGLIGCLVHDDFGFVEN